MQLHNKSEHKIYGGRGKRFKHFEGGDLLGDDIGEDVEGIESRARRTSGKQSNWEMTEVN